MALTYEDLIKQTPGLASVDQDRLRKIISEGNFEGPAVGYIDNGYQGGEGGTGEAQQIRNEYGGLFGGTGGYATGEQGSRYFTKTGAAGTGYDPGLVRNGKQYLQMDTGKAPDLIDKSSFEYDPQYGLITDVKNMRYNPGKGWGGFLDTAVPLAFGAIMAGGAGGYYGGGESAAGFGATEGGSLGAGFGDGAGAAMEGAYDAGSGAGTWGSDNWLSAMEASGEGGSLGAGMGDGGGAMMEGGPVGAPTGGGGNGGDGAGANGGEIGGGYDDGGGAMLEGGSDLGSFSNASMSSVGGEGSMSFPSGGGSFGGGFGEGGLTEGGSLGAGTGDGAGAMLEGGGDLTGAGASTSIKDAFGKIMKYGPMAQNAIGLLKGNNADKYANQLRGIGGTQRAVAEGMIRDAQAGNINPSDQAAIDKWVQEATAKAKQYYATAGLSDSSQAKQAMADIQAKAVAMKEQSRQQMLQMGMSQLNITDKNMQMAVQAEMQGDQAAGKAQSDFFNTYGRWLANDAFGGGNSAGGSKTNNMVAANDTGTMSDAGSGGGFIKPSSDMLGSGMANNAANAINDRGYQLYVKEQKSMGSPAVPYDQYQQGAR